MVDSSIITAFIVNIVVCFGLPLAGVLYLLIAKKRAFIPVLVGAAVFTVFQLITRLPLIGALSPMVWWRNMMQNPWLYGIFLGLTAGLFEEFGRYFGYRTLLKGRDRWIDGFAFGVGHGGIEAIALGGISHLNNLSFAQMINNGQINQLSAALPEGTLNQLVSQITSLQPIDVYLSGFERFCALLIQIALSILVLMAVRKRRLRLVWLAVALHTLVNAPIVILPQVFGASIYDVEIFIAALAVLAVLFIILSRRAFRQPEQPDVPIQSNPDII